MLKLLRKLFIKNYNDVNNPKVRTAYGKLSGIVGIICNFILFSSKMIVGLISGSVSISADAINNLSDASSSVITLIGFKLSEKPADKEHPFGHARFEYVSGLIVAMLIMVIGIELGKTSITKILSPTPVTFSIVTIAVLIFSILVKLWMAFFNRRVGKEIGSTTLEATYADSRNDVITTSAVLIASLISYFCNINLDGYMGLAVAVFILISGIGIIRDTINPLLGEAPTEELSDEIAEKILSNDNVLGVHDLTVHDYGPGRRFATVHVEMSADEDPLISHDIIDTIERQFLAEDNIHLVIHYDPVVTNDEEINEMHRKVLDVLKEIDSDISMHDFRMVRGVSFTNLIFDVVVPNNKKIDSDILKETISQKLETPEHTYYPVITIDTNYTSLPTNKN